MSLNKTTFEELIARRSENLYQDSKRTFAELINNFICVTHPHMNAHESGSSMKHDMQVLTNNLFENRKSEIIKKIQAEQLDKILNDLNNVKFLFETEG